MARQAEERKRMKYALLDTSHYFAPVAIETYGVMGLEALSYFEDLGSRLKRSMGEVILTTICGDMQLRFWDLGGGGFWV